MNRMMFELLVCREGDQLKHVGDFAIDVKSCASIYLPIIPPTCKPSLERLVSIRSMRQLAKYHERGPSSHQ